MAYVSKNLLGRALKALAGQHPLLLFSVPAMTRAGISSAASQADADAHPTRFGGTQERELLDTFYRVPGAPSGSPYFSPSAGDFVSERYAETSLQRQRKDKAKPTSQQIFFETGERNNRGYAIRSDIAAVASKDQALLPRGPVPLLALGIWMYRTEEVESAEELISRIVAELKLDRDDFIGAVYSDSADAVDMAGGLEDAPISPEAMLQLVGAPPPAPPPPSLGSISELVERIEESMSNAGVALADGLVARVIRSWLNRDVAVLVV